MSVVQKQKNQRFPWRWLAVAVVVGVAAVMGGKLLLGPAVPVLLASQGDLLQSVVASGKVKTPQRVELGSQITGKVARIPVAEGQRVSAGQILIELEASEWRAAVAQAQATLGQAEARLRQIRELAQPVAEQNQRQAVANQQQAERQYQRNHALHAKGFIGQSQLDEAQRTLEVSNSQLQAAQLQVRSNQRGGSDYLLAESNLQQAQASLDLARAKLDYAVIKAPLAGILIARNVEAGDVAQPGKVLMVLSPAGDTEVVVQIDEKNLSLLALGQTALASADAYPQQRFAAEVVYINPAVDPLRGSVEVRLRVKAPPAYLRQDMTVSVDIEAARRSNVVSVPTEAVRDLNGSQPWVMVVRAGNARRQPVKVGLRSDGRIEIIDGISASDQLIAASQGLIHDGDRVRVAD